jgi:hypothetical protein
MSNEPSQTRLDSWKEIAVYLKCDERTAMRWEQTGLPVHRLPGRGRGRVFAYAAEVDAWLRGVKPQEASAVAAATGTDISVPPAGPGPFVAWLARIPRLAQAGIIAAAAIGLFVVVSLVFRASTVAPLANVVLQGNRFEGLDAEGRKLWAYPLPSGTRRSPADPQPRLSYIGRLASGGQNLVLTSLPFPQPAIDHTGNERQLFCFSDTGKLLWNFAPSYTLSYNSGDFGPPWHIRQWRIYRIGGEPRIAVVLTHETWWPSLIVVLDARGREVARFVNAGHIFSLASVESPSGTRLLAGGVSNANDRSAFLAVLDGANPSGTSPEDGQSEFDCRNCSPGHPLRYFVFPRSELNVVTLSHFNRTSAIRPGPSIIDVETVEVGPEQLVGVSGIFEFTDDFSLVRAAWSDGYAELHHELERNGMIHHSWNKCPDRYGPRVVRVWDPQHGWTEIHPNADRHSR